MSVPCTCGGSVCGITEAGDLRVRRYRCRGCRQRVPWCYGADDDMPFHCDDCWSRRHAEAA